jgi:hypothetical protein
VSRCRIAGNPSRSAGSGRQWVVLQRHGPQRRPGFELTSNSSDHPFQKVFLYVSAQAAPKTRLTLTSPTDAYLYYVPQDHWQSARLDDEVRAGLTRSVTVSRCSTDLDDLTGYFGGVVLGAGPWVTIEVQPLQSDELPTGGPTTVNLLLPGPCPAG